MASQTMSSEAEKQSFLSMGEVVNHSLTDDKVKNGTPSEKDDISMEDDDMPLLYRVQDHPPLYLTIAVGFQVNLNKNIDKVISSNLRKYEILDNVAHNDHMIFTKRVAQHVLTDNVMDTVVYVRCIIYICIGIGQTVSWLIWRRTVFREKDSPMTKATTPETCQKGKVTQNNVAIKFDYTAIADRLRTVSLSIYSHLTSVVRTVNCRGSRQHPRNWGVQTGLRSLNLPTNRNSRVIKRTHIQPILCPALILQ